MTAATALPIFRWNWLTSASVGKSGCSAPAGALDQPNGTTKYRFDGRAAEQSDQLSEHLDRSRPPRIALYSHDTLGLGHVRRNLLIAQALANSPLRATTLLITGAHAANFFTLPPGVDCLTLPRLQKKDSGDYESAQLDISLQELARLRTNSIRVAIEEFRPDLLIVDKVPVGAFGELLPALSAIQAAGRTRCVFGLRDVLDDPATVARECLCDENLQAIEQFYDAVWVYGDKDVYDLVSEYQLPEQIRAKTQFTGYLDQSGRLELVARRAMGDLSPGPGNLPLAVCVLGGGQDGAAIADTFVDALPGDKMRGVIVAGPFMPRTSLDRLRQKASRVANLTVVDFSPEADLLIREADHVVAMAGYNTVCSILSFGKRALLVPRAAPRREQLLRAQRLAQRGIVDVMRTEELDVSHMHNWLCSTDAARARAIRPIDLNGLPRLCELASSLLASSAPGQAQPHAPSAADNPHAGTKQ